MNTLKVCFIGVGSIAKRHICNLKKIYGNNVIIDVVRRGSSKEKSDLSDKVRDCVNQVYYGKNSKYYDAIFITNPTKLHYKTLEEYAVYSENFFIEKPVFVTGEEVYKKLPFYKEKTYYVACPLRYTRIIQYLKQNIDMSKIYSARCICSSYLPEWREGVDYRQTYSAQKELGGGVSIDLIHEWDYLCYLFGYPKKVLSFMDKKSKLEIDTDDIAIYIAEYEDKLVELHLDYFGRKTVRKIEFIGEEDTIEADLTEQKITYLKSDQTIWLKEDRDEYQTRELHHFFDIIQHKEINDNNIEKACKILRITRGKTE